MCGERRLPILLLQNHGGDSNNGWTSGKDGNALTSNQGVQVTTGVSGANATTKTSFTNVSSVAVQYCTNAKAGTGTIKIQVGSNSAQSFSVAAPSSEGTTLKTKTFTFSPNQTGTVKISVDCTKNSIYIYSVTITTTDAVTCNTPPTVTAASNSNITSTTATVSCSSGITSLGSAGCSITSYGFVYGTTANPTTSNTKVQVGTTYTTTGTAFSKELTGLTANTTYYVRPYATNGNGTAYGTQTSFKTAEIKYTVTYNANGATGTVPTDANEYVSGATVTAKSHGNLAKTGYSFSGWKRNDNSAIVQESATFTMPASNLTLTAQWQINTYTVTWIVDGVTKRTDTGVAYNTSKTAPTVSPIPCGDVIAGWTDAVDGNYEHDTSTLHSGATPSITITSDKTFYAVFADYAD